MSDAEARRVVDMSGFHVADTWPKVIASLKHSEDYPGLTAADYLQAMGEETLQAMGEETLQAMGEETEWTWTCGCKGYQACEPCERHRLAVDWQAYEARERVGSKKQSP